MQPTQLLGNKTIEGKWAASKDKLAECEAQFVPKRKCIYRRLKPVWMTYKALKCLKRKHRTLSKYICVDHPAAKSAKIELRKARRNFETKLAQKIKSDKKSFFAYVRSRLDAGRHRGHHGNNRKDVYSRLTTMACITFCTTTAITVRTFTSKSSKHCGMVQKLDKSAKIRLAFL